MSRLVASMALALVLALAAVTVSASTATVSQTSVIRATSHDELNRKWCAARTNIDHIIILPASLFVDSRVLTCDSGAYKLYRVVSGDDPDDFEYYIDPPFGKKNRLGCDGKAGLKMKVIAVNCRPE